MSNSASFLSDSYDDPSIEQDEEQQMAYYMDILRNWETYTRPLYLFTDKILNGFNGDYSERVPDEFLECVYKFRNEHVEQITIDKWVRLSSNTDPILRRLYAFWKAKCEGKFVKRSVRCFMVTMAIDDFNTKWSRSLDRSIYNLVWNKTDVWDRPRDVVPNTNDLVIQLREYWYEPMRIGRLTLEYIKKVLEPCCEN